MYGYADHILIGTDTGFRLAKENATTGNLTIGALVETGSPVRQFVGRGRFVWFTWEAFDAGASGLGRIDMQHLTDEVGFVPAYASDLMYESGTGAVHSVATFNGRIVFTVVSGGVIYEDETGLYPLSANGGTIESGTITYNLAEQKVAVSVLIEASITEADDNVVVSLKADDNPYSVIGTATSNRTILTTDTQGSRLELKLKLDGGGDLTTPTVHLVQLKSHPKVKGTKKIVIPIILRDQVDRSHRVPAEYDVLAELRRLEGWWSNQNILTLQEGDRLQTAVLEDFQFRTDDETVDHAFRQGTFYAEFKIIDDRS